MVPAAAINHVLGQHAWARARLAAHAGKTIRVEAGPLGFALAVTAAGLVEAAAEGAQGDMLLRLDPVQIPGMLADPSAALAKVRIEGDAELAQLVGLLAREVRWDGEEDLSRIIGDVPAHYAARAARSLAAWGRDAASRVTGTTTTYLAEEGALLVRAAEMEELGRGISEVRDACARLEKRLGLLEAAARTGPAA